MRDAIRMSIDHLKEKAKKDKKVLVVVTDGNDNSSLISLENLVKSAQDSGVLVYTVGPAQRGRAPRGQTLPPGPRGTVHELPAANPIFPKKPPTWTAWRTRWRTTSGINTPWPTRP